jgi:hypothetical protein
MIHDLPHPGPLPKERENRSPASRVADESHGSLVLRSELPITGDRLVDIRKTRNSQSLFPLPGGEGQGEGERFSF